MNKLQFLKQIACLGQFEIEEIFSTPGEAWIVDLFIEVRKAGGNNFDFIFKLDKEDASDVFEYLKGKK